MTLFQGGVFFCQSFSSGNNVELEFSCNVGQGSCPVNDEVFFFKPTVTALGKLVYSIGLEINIHVVKLL